MKKCNYILLIIGKKSHLNKWMKWEFKKAKQANIDLKFSAVKIDPRFINHPGLPNNTVFTNAFTLDGILRLINN